MNFASVRLFVPLCGLVVSCGLACSTSAANVNAPATAAAPAAVPAPTCDGTGEWGRRQAEHLLNRASFGGSTADVDALVKLGRAAAVEQLLAKHGPKWDEATIGAATLHRRTLEDPAARAASLDVRRAGYTANQNDLIGPANKYANWWIERMVAGDDPLRDHMTIFWHGHFVSSFKEVGRPGPMIAQIDFLRENALGSFEVLARGMGRDPAMLRYLNNDKNVKEHPNENWARELMELFTLGDGNYTETDIKQAARAFTGWTHANGKFEFDRREHDFGQKTVLGVTGNLDGDHVTDAILAQPACARFISGKLIAYFEGTPASADRVEDYAAHLRSNGYDIGKLLKKLFNDPQFYREEVLGTRVAGPIEYLVGAARRSGITPPGQLVLAEGAVLGQRLFWPPSVKGWDGNMSWITTGTLMHRSNMVGVLLGLVDIETLMEKSDTGVKASRSVGFNHVQYIQQTNWAPNAELQKRYAALGVNANDAAIATAMLDDLLAVPATPETARGVAAQLTQERRAAGIAEGSLLANADGAEPVLRRVAHVILSLPEAQLN